MRNKSWKNRDNLEFYSKTSQHFRDLAVLGGLDTYCDLKQITSYLLRANSILDLGSGYGRVIMGLRALGYEGSITGIEWLTQFYEELQKNLSQTAHLIHADIKNFKLDDQFDMILWMWSGFSDFNKDEHIPILKNILTHLKPNGILVIDTFSPTATCLISTAKPGMEEIISGEEGSYLHFYSPTDEEMDAYAAKLNLNIKHIHYVTPKDRPRILHLFFNS